MEHKSKKILHFTELVVWQKGHELVIEIYKCTKQFPKEEQFGLTSQIRRAAVSVTSNIAEGFGRASWAEKSHFFSFSCGSLIEVQNQLLVARDVGYLTKPKFDALYQMSVETEILLKGLQHKTKQYAHK